MLTIYFVAGLILGLWLGVILGGVTVGALAAAKRADQDYERQDNEPERERMDWQERR